MIRDGAENGIGGASRVQTSGPAALYVVCDIESPPGDLETEHDEFAVKLEIRVVEKLTFDKQVAYDIHRELRSAFVGLAPMLKIVIFGKYAISRIILNFHPPRRHRRLSSAV